MRKDQQIIIRKWQSEVRVGKIMTQSLFFHAHHTIIYANNKIYGILVQRSSHSPVLPEEIRTVGDSLKNLNRDNLDSKPFKLLLHLYPEKKKGYILTDRSDNFLFEVLEIYAIPVISLLFL